jgi:hypothetical protein
MNWLDMTPRRVQVLVKRGIIPRVRHGQYDLREAVRAYVRHARRLTSALGGHAGMILKRDPAISSYAGENGLTRSPESGERDNGHSEYPLFEGQSS